MAFKTKISFIAVSSTFIIGLWLLTTANKTSDNIDTLLSKAEKRNFIVSVEALGELDAARSNVLFSQIRGDRGKIVFLAEDGSKVKQNEVLVRLDPTFFEEEVTRLKAKVLEFEAVVLAHEQILEWEKIQADREIQSAEFDLRAARLDLVKLEKGDGPMELNRLEKALQDAKQDWEIKKGYINDLERLQKRGYANSSEISQAHERIDEAMATHEAAKRQYQSYKDFVLPSSMEKARAQVARAEMNLEQIKKGVGFKIGKAMASLKKTKQEMEASISSLKLAETELKNTVITAPIPGIAVLPEAFRGGKKRKPRIGDVVWQNQPLVYLPDISKMIVKTQIREIDLHKVEIGKFADVFIDAFPNLKLSGVVLAIGVLAESNTEVSSVEKFFQVTISIEENDQRLRPGMTARVVIASAHVENALSVPVQSVFNEAGVTFCYVNTYTGFLKRIVSIGAQNENWAEILHGISTGESVAMSMPPPRKIKGHEQ